MQGGSALPQRPSPVVWESMKTKTMAADAVFFCYTAFLLLTVLPFGSNRPWSAMLAAVLAGIIALAWALAVLRSPDTPGIALRPLRTPMALYGVTLLWALIQTLPVTPADWAHPVWAEAGAVLGPLSPRIALSPTTAVEDITRLLATAAVFFLALQGGRSGRRATLLIDSLGLGLGCIAAYGLAVYASGNERIFWFAKWAYQDDLTAVLVNRNHYATLAGLGLLCALSGSLRRLSADGGRETLRRLLGGRDLWLVGLLLSLPLNLFALLLTHSRAGMVVTGAGLLTLLLLSGHHTPRRLLPWLALGGSGLLILFVELNDRLPALMADADTRMQVWSLSWDLLMQRPWLGIGLGGFPDAFQAIRPATVTQFWDHAHNTWLESLIELGIPAALCLFSAILWAWGRCLSGALKRRRNRDIPALGTAAGVLVGLHALVDFSVQIPAVSFLTAALLGLGTAQSWASGLGRYVK